MNLTNAELKVARRMSGSNLDLNEIPTLKWREIQGRNQRDGFSSYFLSGLRFLSKVRTEMRHAEFEHRTVVIFNPCNLDCYYALARLFPTLIFAIRKDSQVRSREEIPFNVDVKNNINYEAVAREFAGHQALLISRFGYHHDSTRKFLTRVIRGQREMINIMHPQFSLICMKFPARGEPVKFFEGEIWLTPYLKEFSPYLTVFIQGAPFLRPYNLARIDNLLFEHNLRRVYAAEERRRNRNAVRDGVFLWDRWIHHEIVSTYELLFDTALPRIPQLMRL